MSGFESNQAFGSTLRDLVHSWCDRHQLAAEEDRETWLTAPWSEARKLQRPLASGELEIVHRTALKYLPGVEGIPSGDPLRMSQPREPSLF